MMFILTAKTLILKDKKNWKNQVDLSKRFYPK